jgi:hypothetical protein
MRHHEDTAWMGDTPIFSQEVETIVMPVEGVRFWHFENDSLSSAGISDVLWPKYEKSEAKCCCTVTPGCAPCKGGLYAYRSMKDLIADNLGMLTWLMFGDLVGSMVVGTVSLWGTIIECSQGYRAQYGYPSGLYNFGSVPLVSVSQSYGVPILDNPFTAEEMSILKRHFLGKIDGVKFFEDRMHETIDQERLDYQRRHPGEFDLE